MGTKREQLKTSSLVELKSIASKEGVRGARSKTKYTEHNREDLIRDIRYNRKERKESCLLDLLPSSSGSFFREVVLSISIGLVGSTILYFYRKQKETPKRETPTPVAELPKDVTIELRK